MDVGPYAYGGTYVGQGTSSLNNEKGNLCRTGHIYIKQREVEQNVGNGTSLHQTMRSETYVGQGTSPSNTDSHSLIITKDTRTHSRLPTHLKLTQSLQ